MGAGGAGASHTPYSTLENWIPGPPITLRREFVSFLKDPALIILRTLNMPVLLTRTPCHGRFREKTKWLVREGGAGSSATTRGHWIWSTVGVGVVGTHS